MALKFSPSREFLLVAACCAWPPSEPRNNRIREAAAGSIDWNRFRHLAERHRVIGLMHNGITRTQIVLPVQIAQDIAAQAVERAQHDLALAAEAVRLNRQITAAGVPALFVKGSTLGVLAYGRLGLRESKDIDVLVPETDIPIATGILENADYRRSEPPQGIGEAQMRMWKILRKDYLYVHREHSHEVELHWRLFDNPLMTNDRFGTSPGRTVPVGGANELPTLGNDDLFAYLCLHGALHGWMRLKWLADIAALVSPMPESEIERIHAAAESRNAGRASAQALLLCHRLFHTEIPAALLARLKSDRNTARLERAALWALTAGGEMSAPPDLPFGGLRINFTHFLLSRGWRYRLAELKLAFVSPIDVLMLPLPSGLHFLYAALRLPLWIWRKLARR